MRTNILILPGISSSGPQHWQSLWEKANPAFQRIEQEDWLTPACGDWVKKLEAAVAESGPNTLLIAHSLACLLVANWAVSTSRTIKGALLVAPPDPAGANFPAGATGFAPLPEVQLPFKSILVASRDDHYASIEFSKTFAAGLGSVFIEAGALGHINADSGIGEWSEGFRIFKSLIKSCE